MRRAFCFVIIFLIMFWAVHLVPNAISDNNEIEWTEQINIEGNCSMDNVRKHLQVNRTVVEIIVNLSWTIEEGWANLDMWIDSWNPTNASDYVVLTWNYNGSLVSVDQSVSVVFTLSVYSNVTGITEFSFDIWIVGVEN